MWGSLRLQSSLLSEAKVALILVLDIAAVANGYPSPKRDKFSDPYEIDDNLAAFFISMAVVVGVCLALAIAVCICFRCDNCFLDIAKHLDARWHSYKHLPDGSSKQTSTTEVLDLDTPQDSAMKHSTFDLADGLKWTNHPKVHMESKTSVQDQNQSSLMGRSGPPDHGGSAESDPSFEQNAKKTSDCVRAADRIGGAVRRQSIGQIGNGDGARSPVSPIRTGSTRKRPPLLRQLENEISVMSMAEYDEGSFASAWEARQFFLDSDNFNKLAAMSESELDGYRIYFNTEEWDGIKSRWKLSRNMQHSEDVSSDSELGGEMELESDDEYRWKRLAAARRSTVYRAALCTVLSGSESEPSRPAPLSTIASDEVAERDEEMADHSALAAVPIKTESKDCAAEQE